MTSAPRKIERNYIDPLDAVWLTVAQRIGFSVRRAADVYAATDGKGVITLSAPENFDADDCLAQMILHELCHSLVEGPESLTKVDWGLDNESERDVWKEHACLRVQAALLDEYDLRKVFAPTTEFRIFYDTLDFDPLKGGLVDSSISAAKRGLERAKQSPWHPHLHSGLQATTNIIKELRTFGTDSETRNLPFLWTISRK